MKQYKVTMPFGKYKNGQIVNDSSRYIRRRLQEQSKDGDCLKEISEVKKEKMNEKPYENKMVKDDKKENK